MRPLTLKSEPHIAEMEPARAGFHKIVVEILKRAPAEDAVLIAWRMVCGSTVSERTQALDFHAGALRVQVPDAAWRTQLRDFVPQYLAQLNQMVNVKVERIEFVMPESHRPPARA